MSNNATENGEQLPATIQGTQLVRAADSAAVAEAVTEYKQIQRALDKAMPDCLMTIQGRPFRKRNYWRAVATAFNLSVECVKEEQCKGNKDWGYTCTYRATAPNGRFADGDGACFASEKQGGARTVHNVRAHSHTRGYNRSVSNLVGFGEVSADELGADSFRAQSPSGAPQAQPQEGRMPPKTVSNYGHSRPRADRPCPQCGAAMWDNCAKRDGGWKGPAWKCSEDSDHVLWNEGDYVDSPPASPQVIEADVTERYTDVGPEEVF